MNQAQAILILNEWDKRGRCVFSVKDFIKLFPEAAPKTLTENLRRLTYAKLITRVARGVYVNPLAQSLDSQIIERIAKTLRRGEYNYISLESALSEYGIISQVPIDRLTVMTTGRKGFYQTQYGCIEFTHTKRITSNILKGTQLTHHVLRIATPTTAWRDLKRVGRNTHLVDQQSMNNEK